MNLKIVTEIGARVISKYSTFTAFRILDIIIMLGHSALFGFKKIFDQNNIVSLLYYKIVIIIKRNMLISKDWLQFRSKSVFTGSLGHET